MTLAEFKSEFETNYDYLSGSSAPPIDDYEISLFLTQAQEILVKEYYNPQSNRYLEGFDTSEKRRRNLSNLIEPGYNGNPQQFTLEQMSESSRFFSLEDDLMFIIYEKAKLKSEDVCFNNNLVDVMPITYDDYSYLKDNPFKKPDETSAWRLDYKVINDKRHVEIITAENTNAYEYHYKYLRYPNAIIISNLNTETINNISGPSNCELPNDFHREIVSKAVELALEASGNPRFKTKSVLKDE